MSTHTETLQIEGMSCGHCVRAVRQALEEVEGIEVQSVEIGSAQVIYDPSATDHGDLVEVIEDAGYTVLSVV